MMEFFWMLTYFYLMGKIEKKYTYLSKDIS
jgi:hypothetical protein